MAGFDYLGLQKVVSNTLGLVKQGVIQYVVVTPGTGFNPGEPQRATPITINAVARGVTAAYQRNELVIASDLLVTTGVISGVDNPKLNDEIIIDGNTYKIVVITPAPAAGPTLAYTFVVRR